MVLYLINGIFKSYYENGQLKYECNYINGILEGIYKEYHENGQLKYACTFVNGKKKWNKKCIKYKVFILFI